MRKPKPFIPGRWPLRNFSPYEMQCRCPQDCDYKAERFLAAGQRIPLHPALVKVLNHVRKVCGYPLTLTSALRCPKHEAEASKPKPGTGSHCCGMAVDIFWGNWSGEKKLAFLRILTGTKGVGGLGVGPSFVHVDVKHPRVWGYQ